MVLKEGSIAKVALERLCLKLTALGSPPSDLASCRIGSLMATCEEGLKAQLPPAYYLASIDPGQGKTLAMAEFLKLALDMGRLEEGGALIGVSRLSEITTYIEATGLPPDHFGVLTSSPELNAAGVCTSGLNRVPILFTTQQMILSRVAGRAFKDTADFHYRGKPRALRIWDESLIPSQPIIVQRDELGRLLPFRLHHSSYVEAIERLMATLSERDEGELCDIDQVMAAGPRTTEPQAGLDAGATTDLVDRLRRLAGQTAWVVADGRMGKALVGADEGLPADFAPVVILDASGRLRGTYKVWEKQRRDLVRLPSVVSDYSQLEVHLWQTVSGKAAMRDTRARSEVLQGLAEAINEYGEGWLVIHYKWDERFPHDLSGLIRHRPERVRFTHWGNHHGTNEFRSARNVALVGQLIYRRSDYIGLGLASGLCSEDLAEDLPDMREGELAHHYLQAACRGSARQVSNGIAGQSRLFLVATPSRSLKALLRRVFPGCSISDWNAGTDMSGKVKAAAEYLIERFADPTTMKVRKADVRRAIDIERTATFASHVMRNREFRYFMSGHWICEDGQYFERVEPFASVDDGYVYEPDAD